MAETKSDHGARLLICVIALLLAIFGLTRGLATWAVILSVVAIVFFVVAAGYFAWRSVRALQGR